MCRSMLYEVGAAFASCVGTPTTKRDKAGNKEDAHIESGKQEDEIRRLERSLYMINKRLGDSRKEHCWDFFGAECTMGRFVFVGRYKHVGIENYRERDLIYPRGGYVISRVCDPKPR